MIVGFSVSSLDGVEDAESDGSDDDMKVGKLRTNEGCTDGKKFGLVLGATDGKFDWANDGTVLSLVDGFWDGGTLGVHEWISLGVLLCADEGSDVGIDDRNAVGISLGIWIMKELKKE